MRWYVDGQMLHSISTYDTNYIIPSKPLYIKIFPLPVKINPFQMQDDEETELIMDVMRASYKKFTKRDILQAAVREDVDGAHEALQGLTASGEVV